MQPLLEFAYTEDDTPGIRARIGSDLQKVVHACAAADKHLRSLVLTGGFSRGEGTFRDGAPVNDYDLVAVRTRPGGGAIYRALGPRLSERVGIEVDLLPIWQARLPRVGRKLFWLDLRLGGRVIAGDVSVLASLPRFGADAIDPGEPSRLLGNRAAGLILALPAPGAREDPRQTALQSAKAIIAAMDAQLLHRGEYAPTLRGRVALSRGHPDAALFADAVQWKLHGGDAPSWDDARRALLDAVAATRADASADGWTERAFHLLRARRLRASPSREVRVAAWELLRASRFPDGPEPTRAESILRSLAGARGAHTKERFFAARATTLQ